MSTEEPAPRMDEPPAERATEPESRERRDPPQPAGSAQAPDSVPDAETLERIAEPVVVRRAPRYAAFIRTGVVIGVVLGLLISATPRSAPDENRTVAIAITMLGLALLGALLGAATAVVADRRSDRGH